MIGPNLVIECDDHIFDRVGVTIFENRDSREIGSVTIENDVWLGAGVTVLKGVKIGEGVVVGAHSVVSKSIPPYTIAVGTPCKPIRTRFSADRLREHLQLIDSQYSAEAVEAAWLEMGLDNR